LFYRISANAQFCRSVYLSGKWRREKRYCAAKQGSALPGQDLLRVKAATHSRHCAGSNGPSKKAGAEGRGEAPSCGQNARCANSA
jgi:hypothetical protein